MGNEYKLKKVYIVGVYDSYGREVYIEKFNENGHPPKFTVNINQSLKFDTKKAVFNTIEKYLCESLYKIHKLYIQELSK